MIKFSYPLRPLRAGLILILFITSIGSEKTSAMSNFETSCGEWIDEIALTGNTNLGIGVNPSKQQPTESNCQGVFTLTNQVGYGFQTRYSLYLRSIPNESHIEFLYDVPILVTGLPTDIKVIPNNINHGVTIALQGEINTASIAVDTGLWVMSVIEESVPLPPNCFLPPPTETTLLAIRLAPILYDSVDLGIKRKFSDARTEFSKAIFAYFNQAGQIGEGMAYNCIWEAAEKYFKKPLVLPKLAWGYVSWLGTTLYDFIKYGGPAKDTTVVLSYIPPSHPNITPTGVTPPVGSNLRQIGFLKDGNVWLMSEDGNNQEQITNSGQISYFRWSPDGERIFYSKIDIIDRLYVYDLASHQENSITIPRPSVDSPPNFDVSPDGKTLLLLIANEGTVSSYSLLSLDLGTSNIKKITSLDGAFVRVRFLNASDEVVLAECTQACAIHTLNLKTLQSKQFTDLVFGWTFDILPDKRAIAVEHSLGFIGLVPCGNDPACKVPSGIYEFDLNTRKYSPLVLDEVNAVTEPDISADNNYLVFQRENNVEIKNLKTGELRTLTPGLLPSWRPSNELSTPPPSSASPSGNWIAFINKDNIWISHPDGSELKAITNNPSSSGHPILDYKWSPDGSTLAYSVSSQIYLYDIQTSQITTFTTNGAGGFDWSLNGKQLIYDSSFSEGSPWSNNGIWVLRLENGKTRQVVPPTPAISGLRSPQWSSEGSHVLFYIPSVFSPAYQAPAYGVADFTTGKSLRLPITLVEGQTTGSCRWSPNDLIIACASAGDESSQKPDLRLIDVSGKIIKKITLPEKMQFPMVRWSPDGKKLAIGYSTDNKSWTDILTLDTETMETLTPGLPSEWSSGGERLLVTKREDDTSSVISIVNVSSGQSLDITQGSGGIWQPQQTAVSTSAPTTVPENGLTPVSTLGGNVQLPTHPLDRTSVESVMEWIVYALDRGDATIFEQLIMNDYVYYGHGMTGGRNKISRTDFLRMLSERIASHPICEGYIYNDGSAGGNVSLFVITNGWKPQWQDQQVVSDWIGFTLPKLGEGFSLDSAYFHPAGVMLGNRDKVGLLTCPAVQ